MSAAYDFWAKRLSRAEERDIDLFWHHFEHMARSVSRGVREGVPIATLQGRIRKALGPLADRLTPDVEIDADGPVLVLSPELRHSQRPLARAAMLRAPAIEGWSVRDVRLAVATIPEAARAIAQRSRSDALAVEIAVPKRGAHRTIDVLAAGHGDPEFLSDQTGIVFSVMLGERADQDWLGLCLARPTADTGLFDRLARLTGRTPQPHGWLAPFRDAVDGLIGEIEAERPPARFSESKMRLEDIVSFRLRPAEDDPLRRRDAQEMQSRYPALVAARLAGTRISSRRFSRHGEVFCGVKIGRTEATPFAEIGDIASLGLRLEDALVASGAGGITGRGPGARHIYFDLALVDIEAGVRAIARVLSDQSVTGPAWLIFDEAGLEEIYLPLTPRTPASPADPV